MLTLKTVLVLGAGASKPFRFPVGNELVKQLTLTLFPGKPLHECLTNLAGFPGDQIEAFRSSLQKSASNSVDSFLEHNPRYLDVGKAAMACALIPSEDDDFLFNYQSDNWLRYLWGRLATKPEEFAKNTLTIVTFNYDRTVEHFFHTALKNLHALDDDATADFLRSIPIIHLHGQLGHLPWEKKKYTRPFDKVLSKDSIAACVANLKIISEDIEEGRDKEFTAAKGAMAEAEQILFLGFGFNYLNVQRLDICNLEKRPLIKATAFGLVPNEVGPLNELCSLRVSFIRHKDCIKMIRDEMRWS